MSSFRTHIRNLAFNWGGHVAALVVMFFLSPYIVGKLDAVSYGIWSLLNVLTGYMGIFDLGVRASVGRHVALYLGKNDEVGVDETIRAGFGFFSLTGILILLVGVLLGWFFPDLFKGVGQEYYDTVRILLPLMVVNVWLSAIAAIYSSVLAAHDRFDIARGVDMVVLLVRTIGTVYVLEMDWGLWGLVFTIIAANLCAVAGNRLFAGKVHVGLRSFPVLYSKKRIQELFSYGLPAFITSAAVKIAGQSDLVIVGIFLSVADVREYSVGAMIIYYSSTFIKLIARTFFPAIQRAAAKEAKNDMLSLFYKQLKLSLLFGIVVYLGYCFYAKVFIKIWMLQPSFGLHSVNSSAQIMSVLAISSLPLLVVNPCVSVLAAVGKIGITSKVTIMESLCNVLLSIFFVTILRMGLLGVAMGTLFSRYLITGIFIPCLLCKEVGVTFTSFVVKILSPSAFAICLFALICWISLACFEPDNWLTFFLQVIAVGSCGFLVVSMIVVPDSLRKFFSRLAFSSKPRQHKS